MLPTAQFPIPPFTWPQVGRQWPAWNIESDQADGLVLWMPWGGGTVPGGHSYVDQISGLAFTKGGTPVWIADSERGWSLEFDDGNTECLSIGQAIPSATPLTLACWFYSDAELSQTPLSICSTAANDWFTISLRGAGAENLIRGWTRRGPGTAFATTSTGYTLNTWHHTAATFASPTSRAILIDAGGKGTNATDVTPINLDTTSIGCQISSVPAEYFSGRLSDGRIYNVAKTDAQVAEFVHPDTKFELFEIPRHLWRLGVVAPPPATIVPVAMHHYRSMRL